MIMIEGGMCHEGCSERAASVLMARTCEDRGDREGLDKIVPLWKKVNMGTTDYGITITYPRSASMLGRGIARIHHVSSRPHASFLSASWRFEQSAGLHCFNLSYQSAVVHKPRGHCIHTSFRWGQLP